MSSEIISAPDLPFWLDALLPFRRRMLRLGDVKLHFIDEGSGLPVLMLHGNPVWSFLWRNVIARTAGRELRIIAPDLLGFGLSDKPRSESEHSVERHIDLLFDFVQALELQDVMVVGHDWGGPIAAGLAMKLGRRVRSAAFLNTAVVKPKRPLRPKAFHKLSHLPVVSDFLFRGLGFPIGSLDRVQADSRSIGPRERRAYRYPFRRISDRAGPLALARMVPNRDDHPSLPMLDAIGDWAEQFEGRVTLIWGTKDPILGRSLERHQKTFKNVRVFELDAGHFLQEEQPEAIAEALLSMA